MKSPVSSFSSSPEQIHRDHLEQASVVPQPATQWKPLTPSPRTSVSSSPFTYAHDSMESAAIDLCFKTLSLTDDPLVDPTFVRPHKSLGRQNTSSSTTSSTTAVPFFFDPPLTYSRLTAHSRHETMPSCFSPPSSAVSSPFTPAMDMHVTSPFLAASNSFLFPQVSYF